MRPRPPDVATDRPDLRSVVRWASWVFLVSLGIELPHLGGSFHGLDDWHSLGMAAAVLDGADGAWAALLGGGGVRGQRPVSMLSWLASLACVGLRAPLYDVTNLVIHAGATTALFVLLVRLIGATRAAIPAAVVGAAVFAGPGPLHQELGWFSARDDALATAFVLAAALAWTAAPSRARALGTAALVGLACGSKPVAFVAPGLLVLVDLVLGRSLLRAGSWRGWAPIVIVIAGLAWVSWDVLAGIAGQGPVGRSIMSPTMTDEAGPMAVLHNLWRGLVATGHSGQPPARGALLLGVVLVGAIVGALQWRLLGAGLAWAALTLVAPWPYLWADPELIQAQGRYLLLPSVGLAIAMAACLGGHWRGSLGLQRRARRAVLGLLALSLVDMLWESISAGASDETTVDALIEALPDLEAGAPEARRLVLVARRLDPGVVGALASGALVTIAPRIAQEVVFVLEGADRPFETGRARPSAPIWDRYGLAPAPFDLDAAVSDPATLVVTQVPSGVQDDAEGAEDHHAARFAYVGVDALPPARAPLALLPSWTGAALDAWTWTGRGPASRSTTGWTMQTAAMPPGNAGAALGRPQHRDALRSPDLALDPATVCRVDVEVGRRGPAPWPNSQDHVFPRGLLVALTWSEDVGLPEPWTTVVSQPLPVGGGLVSLAVGQSPAWRRSARVASLGLHVAGAGPVTVRSIMLVPCGAPVAR